jgi:DNA-binding transcriptional ArsR family regulator
VLATFTALAEESRLRIVDLLRRGPRPVGEIVDKLAIPQPQVSKHLRVLSDAGLVDVTPRAQQRIYALRAQPLRELDAWLEPYRRIWNARLDALEHRLATMDDPPRKPRRTR